MHHPTDRITHTTAFVTPVVEHWLEREIAQWVHPMKDRSDDPSYHELRPALMKWKQEQISVFVKDSNYLVFVVFVSVFIVHIQSKLL